MSRVRELLHNAPGWFWWALISVTVFVVLEAAARAWVAWSKRRPGPP